MRETIFSQIIRGEIPCHRVYEDEMTLAFLDVNPIAAGHTLVIPKEPAPTMDSLSEAAASALGGALPKICRALCLVTGASNYNLLQNNGPSAGQSVMHVHIHIIPAYEDKRGSLNIRWQPQVLDNNAGKDLAQRVAAAIA